MRWCSKLLRHASSNRSARQELLLLPSVQYQCPVLLYFRQCAFRVVKQSYFPASGACNAFGARAFCSDMSLAPVCEEAAAPVNLEVANDKRQYNSMASEAQATLCHYLHISRGLELDDAEHISKHCPVFIHKLLKNARDRDDVCGSLTRMFRFQPINEFDPFFESIGLKPFEFQNLLTRDKSFLEDDPGLLDIYHTFCNYGIARGNIGKIIRDAVQVLSLDKAVLTSRFQAFEDMGLSSSTVAKLVTSCPDMLIGGPSNVFHNLLNWFGDVEKQRDWIGSTLSEKSSYSWFKLLRLLQFFEHLGFSKESIKKLIQCHPDFMHGGSGNMVLSVVGILLKAGAAKKDLYELFQNFPSIPLEKFVKNLGRSVTVLLSIEMSPVDIKKLLVSYPSFLGAAKLKSGTSLQTYLNVGKKRLCKIIVENPSELLKFSIGKKLSALPSLDPEGKSLKAKTDFLVDLGFSKDSEEFKKALRVFRGKGDELHKRYDFLVKSGFGHEDAANMIKSYPHVLNQNICILEAKMAFLTDQLHYPLSALVDFPGYLAYNTDRVKLRFLMYNWLKDRRKASPKLALSSVVACSDSKFMKNFVEKHPDGLKAWENFKSAMSSS